MLVCGGIGGARDPCDVFASEVTEVSIEQASIFLALCRVVPSTKRVAKDHFF